MAFPAISRGYIGAKRRASRVLFQDALETIPVPMARKSGRIVDHSGSYGTGVRQSWNEMAFDIAGDYAHTIQNSFLQIIQARYGRVLEEKTSFQQDI